MSQDLSNNLLRLFRLRLDNIYWRFSEDIGGSWLFRGVEPTTGGIEDIELSMENGEIDTSAAE